MVAEFRDISERTEDKHTHESIDEFINTPITDGLHTIKFGGYPLDILYKDKGSKTTIVTFHAATSEITKLPVFSGAKITADLPANVIFVSDPSLYVNPAVKLGWFLGNQYQDLQTQLPRVISHIQASKGAENLIFFGSSGGGFAALYYSSLFANSLAIGVNPRTIIELSVPDALSRYAEHCWGIEDSEDFKDSLFPKVCSDLRFDTPLPATNTVAYVQNVGDKRYISGSLLPYLNGLKDTSHINLFMKDWGKGHVPADRNFLLKLLTLVTARAPHWNSALEELRFLPSPNAVSVEEIRKELRMRPTQINVLAAERLDRLSPMSDEDIVRRPWPLDSVRPYKTIVSRETAGASGARFQWENPGTGRLYVTTFDGVFGVPPSGPGSEVTKVLGQVLVRVDFVTAASEPHPIQITLFAIQYDQSGRSVTDTWTFEVGMAQERHSALIPLLALTESIRFAFLIHTKEKGAFRLLSLETSHYWNRG